MWRKEWASKAKWEIFSVYWIYSKKITFVTNFLSHSPSHPAVFIKIFLLFFRLKTTREKRDVWVGCQNEGERPFLNFRFIRWKVFKLKATKNERKKSLFCGLEWPRFFLQWQRLLGAQFHLSSCVQRQLKFKKRNKNFFHVCFFLFPMWNIVTMNANMHICDGNIRFI